ncbi:hypothetical protein [Myxococcus vastator]|uniref:hypothetical protein n=1 Tax=Myxococcus vastator TaxID=2709664 RepID=UPI001967D896|nr:hypothetical protein [Myxococcus vastator]
MAAFEHAATFVQPPSASAIGKKTHFRTPTNDNSQARADDRAQPRHADELEQRRGRAEYLQNLLTGGEASQVDAVEAPIADGKGPIRNYLSELGLRT